MRAGYQGEYRVKQKLIEEYGEENVIKTAIGGGQDYIVVNKGRLVKVVEVKEKSGDGKFYPNRREKKQFERIRKFAAEHGIIPELWIVHRRGRGKPVEIKVRRLDAYI